MGDYNHEDHIDTLEERVRFYRSEWENASDRANAMADLYKETAEKLAEGRG